MTTKTRLRLALLVPLLAPLFAGAQDAGTRVTFRDVTRAAGIDFQHTNGRAGNLFVIEVKGSGVAFIDYDDDGDLDIYAVNGSNLPGATSDRPPINHLYRNNGDGSFSDVTAQAGVGDTGYGHGVAAADFDNDGDQDLYVANYGPNVLYRNNGDGTFSDVTPTAGVAGNVWSVSAAFCDFDNDGLLDLYVANYLVFDINSTVRLPTGPGFYDGEVDVLYLNNGDGTFRDVTRENIGNPNGKGLGVVCFDYDGDGDLEIYVANDGTVNLLYENKGNAVFEDVTLFSGTGVNGAGQTEAGMGIDAGDYDDDGDVDLFVTNYKGESNTLMRNEGGGVFTDVTSQANLVAASLPYVTFGAAFFDFDNDGDLDIYAANGHTEENLPDHAQPDQLFENVGNQRYEDVSGSSGAPFKARHVGRGVAFGDFDNDGDVDVLVSNKNGPLTLLQNIDGNRRNWLMVRTVGNTSDRDGIGARIKLSAPGFTRIRDVKTGYSMFSSNDPRVHFGLGALERVDLEIRWPSGTVDRIAGVPANKLVTVTEGSNAAAISELGRIETSYREDSAPVQARSGDDPALLDADVAQLRAMLEEGSSNLDRHLQLGARLALWISARAAGHFEELLARRPDDAELLSEYGDFLQFKFRFEESIDVFERVAELAPDSPRVQASIAALTLRLGRYQECVAAARRAMELGDRSASVALRLGKALAGLGRLPEAQATLEELLRRDPRARAAYLDLGKIHADSGRLEAALAMYRAAVRLDPGAKELRYQLAEVHRRLGNVAEYERQMQLFGLLETESALFKGGMAATDEVRLLHREIRMNPLFGQTRADRQLALRYDRSGDEDNKTLFSLRARASELKDAIAGEVSALRRALRFDPAPARRAAFEEINALRLRFVASMNAAAGYDLAASRTQVGRAHAAFADGAYDDALTGFKAALIDDPDNVQAVYGLIDVLLSERFHLQYARELARMAVRLDQSAESYRRLAQVFRALGDAASAERTLAMTGP